jgi:radical SAM superfamily enzyme YgiQ (UPF0313 family)
MLYLISIYENRLFFEDLGVNRIGAFLEERHIDYKFLYIKCNSAIDETIWDEIAASDFLGISVYDNNIDFADFIVKKVKTMNPTIITFYGSQYASIAYKDILNKNASVDCIMLGDGEYSILELLEKHSKCIPLQTIIKESPYLNKHYQDQENSKNSLKESVQTPSQALIPATSINHSYDRDAAVAYTNRFLDYAHKNTAYGSFYSNDGYGGDCTNFVNQAIHDPTYGAGAVYDKVGTYQWYYTSMINQNNSLSWSAVDNFYIYMTNI